MDHLGELSDHEHGTVSWGSGRLGPPCTGQVTKAAVSVPSGW